MYSSAEGLADSSEKPTVKPQAERGLVTESRISVD